MTQARPPRAWLKDALLAAVNARPIAHESSAAAPRGSAASLAPSPSRRGAPVSVFEEAPEFASTVPAEEWMVERDRDRIAQMLTDSATAVRDAVKGRVLSGRDMDLNYDHPILMLQLMLWHEGYHHGQIKLALKMSGCPLSDDEAGPLTWRVWMNKKEGQFES